jgi:hypothetical protein
MKHTKRDIAATVQLPAEIANPLREVAGQVCIDPTNLARLVLRAFLPRLKKGELAIVNGELVEAPKAA